MYHGQYNIPKVTKLIRKLSEIRPEDNDETRIEIALNLLNDGITDLDFVARMTRLSLEKLYVLVEDHIINN